MAPKMSSGARQYREQMQDTLGSPRTRCFAEPKSQSLSTPVLGSRSRFCGLMSRWQMPNECMYARLLNNWYIYSCWKSKQISTTYHPYLRRQALIKQIYIYLYKTNGYGLFIFGVVTCYFIHSLGYVLQHQIQVHFVFL